MKRKSRGKSCARKMSRRRHRTHRGGAYTGPWTGAYSFGAPISAGSDAQTVVPTSGCMAANPPGYISNYSGPGGLPGVGGGRRRKRRQAGRRSRRQRGGRYTTDLAAGPIGVGPFSAGATVSRISCESGLVNTAPPGAMANPAVGQMGGGAADLGLAAPYSQGGNEAYYAPTAGYGNQASTWVSSTGAPSLLQIPYEARSYNQACLKTN
jgi:hypothetical protein